MHNLFAPADAIASAIACPYKVHGSTLTRSAQDLLLLLLPAALNAVWILLLSTDTLGDQA
jgi:hypothetical protein